MPTYGSSTIQDFTEALQANLQARVDAVEGAGKVPVCDGLPSPSDFERPDWIMLGDVSGSGEVRVFDRTTQPRDEDYTLAVLFSSVRRSRNDQRTVNRRVFELLDHLNQELRSNPRQGIAGVQWARIGGPLNQVKSADGQVRECHLEVGVLVRARI